MYYKKYKKITLLFNVITIHSKHDTVYSTIFQSIRLLIATYNKK